MIVYTSPISKSEGRNYYNPFSEILSPEEIKDIEERSKDYSFLSSGTIYSGIKVLFFKLLNLDFEKVIFNPEFDIREFMSLYEILKYLYGKKFSVEVKREKEVRGRKKIREYPLPFFENKDEILSFYRDLLNYKFNKISYNYENYDVNNSIIITGDFILCDKIIDFLLENSFKIALFNKCRFFLNGEFKFSEGFKKIFLSPPFSYLKPEKRKDTLVLDSYYPGFLSENDKIRIENFLKRS